VTHLVRLPAVFVCPAGTVWRGVGHITDSVSNWDRRWR